MNERPLVVELLLAFLAGAATYAGVKAAQRLEDPYSEPRLTINSLLRGGDSPT